MAPRQAAAVSSGGCRGGHGLPRADRWWPAHRQGGHLLRCAAQVHGCPGVRPAALCRPHLGSRQSGLDSRSACCAPSAERPASPAAKQSIAKSHAVLLTRVLGILHCWSQMQASCGERQNALLHSKLQSVQERTTLGPSLGLAVS